MKNILVSFVIFFVVMGTTAPTVKAELVMSYPVYEQDGIVNICCQIKSPTTGDMVDLIFVYDRLTDEKAFVFLIDEKKTFDKDVDDYMLGFLLVDGPQFLPMQWDKLEDDGTVMFVQLDKKSLLTLLYEIEKNNNKYLSVVLRSESTEDRSWILITDKIPDTINH